MSGTVDQGEGQFWAPTLPPGGVNSDPVLLHAGALPFLAAQCRALETGLDARMPIPADLYRALRPAGATLLQRACGLERHFRSTHRIYLKRDDLSVTGSTKINAALPSCYYAAKEGAREVIAYSMAANWGLAVAFAAAQLGIGARIFFATAALEHRPSLVGECRKLGAVVVPHDVSGSDMGVELLEAAVSEARIRQNSRLVVGCHGNHPAIFQSIAGLEAYAQLAAYGDRADFVVGSVSGGASMSGMMLGFSDADATRLPEFVLAESAQFAVLAREPVTYGTYPYSGLGTRCRIPTAHAALASRLARARAVAPERAKWARELLLECEGIPCAEETGYAVAAAIDEFEGSNDAVFMICVSGGAENRVIRREFRHDKYVRVADNV